MKVYEPEEFITRERRIKREKRQSEELEFRSAREAIK